MINNLKKAYELHDDLGFYVWMMSWKRAERQCKKIEEFKKYHPVYNFIGSILASIW